MCVTCFERESGKVFNHSLKRQNIMKKTQRSTVGKLGVLVAMLAIAILLPQDCRRKMPLRLKSSRHWLPPRRWKKRLLCWIAVIRLG